MATEQKLPAAQPTESIDGPAAFSASGAQGNRPGAAENERLEAAASVLKEATRESESSPGGSTGTAAASEDVSRHGDDVVIAVNGGASSPENRTSSAPTKDAHKPECGSSFPCGLDGPSPSDGSHSARTGPTTRLNGEKEERRSEALVVGMTPNTTMLVRSKSMKVGEATEALEVTAMAGATRKGRWALKYKMKCRFCGGKLCLRCSEQCATRCKGAAIKGLHSHWITDSIIAMQRPSTRLIKAYDVVGQFKRMGVTAVLNLTEAGEHPYCGDGLEESSGFPYLPETFMQEGISFFNFAWEDMTTPPISLLTDIVRVAMSCLRSGGKIAVHCHAGYGRTGLVIASVIVMTRNLTAQQAVALVREKRPMSVQTEAQLTIVGEFADFVRGVRVVYHFTDHARVSLGQHLTQQAFLLHGQESVNLRWLPKPVALATKMLAALAQHKPIDVAQALSGTAAAAVGADGHSRPEAPPVWGMAQEQHLKTLQYASNGNGWDLWEALLESCNRDPASVDPRIPAQLVYDWLAQLAVPPISIAELRRVLPQSVLSAVLSEEEKEATAKTVIADAGEGAFHRLNLLPVGPVRLLQCLTECLRGVRDALAMVTPPPDGEAFRKACLRMAISLLHLNTVHEGVLVGRDVAPDVYQGMAPRPTPASAGNPSDGTGGPPVVPRGEMWGDLRLCCKAMEVLAGEWRAPLRCQPYTKLEVISNRPEVHRGDDDYWHQKRRSVVPPKDIIHEGKQAREETTTATAVTGYTSSVATMSSADSGNNIATSWAARDDAGTLNTSGDVQIQRSSLRRRSLSSDNMQSLLHLPRAADIGSFDADDADPEPLNR